MQLTELEIAGRQGGYLNCPLFVAMCEALGSIPSGEKEEQVKTPEFKWQFYSFLIASFMN